MFCSAQHDRGGRRFNALTFATDHSGFSTSVKSTRFPFAMLKPLVEKNFQFCGWFANSVPATGVGRMTKGGPGALMNSGARRRFNGVRKPCTRERKYQSKLSSANQTEAKRIRRSKHERNPCCDS